MLKTTIAIHTGHSHSVFTVLSNDNKFYALSPPRGLNVVLLDEDLLQVQVTWNVPKEVNGNLMGYQVIWGRKGEAYQMQELPAMRQSYILDVLGLLK